MSQYAICKECFSAKCRATPAELDCTHLNAVQEWQCQLGSQPGSLFEETLMLPATRESGFPGRRTSRFLCNCYDLEEDWDRRTAQGLFGYSNVPLSHSGRRRSRNCIQQQVGRQMCMFFSVQTVARKS